MSSKIFNQDNGLMRALSKIFDMCFLSLIYMVFCLPIITIGAASTSMYYVSAKVLRHNRSYVWREFWSSFKTNFKQSTIIWFFTLLIGVILYLNMMLMTTSVNAKYKDFLVGAYFALGLIIFLITMYVFPILSRLDMKISHLLRLSLYVAFRHILHTLAILAMYLLAATVIYFGVAWRIVVVVIFIPGLTGFLITYPMEHVLKKYMPKKEPRYTEDGEEIVEWYNE